MSQTRSKIRADLVTDGYAVSSLESEWGPEWRGMWRWTNDRLDAFQDDEPSYSEDDAWESAAADAAARILAR